VHLRLRKRCKRKRAVFSISGCEGGGYDVDLFTPTKGDPTNREKHK